MNKKNKILLSIGFISVLVVSVAIMFINNNNYNNFMPSIFEKKWLTDHHDELIDVRILNDVPVIGEEGTGVIFDYINDFKKEVELDFNIMPYSVKSPDQFKDYGFKALSPNEQLTKNDLLFYQDNYVLISTNADKLASLNGLNNVKVGLLETDLQLVKDYLKNDLITYQTVADSAALTKLVVDNQVNYIILPSALYVKDVILLEKYYVNYTMSDLAIKYVLHLNNTEENKHFVSVNKKYYYYWLKKHSAKSFDQQRLQLFYKEAGISDETKTKFNSNSYYYGYLNDLPYADRVNADNIGIVNDYVDSFADFAGIDVKFKRYKEAGALLESNDINIWFKNNDVALSAKQGLTSGILSGQYYVLTNVANDINIHNLASLNNLSVHVLTNSNEYTYFKDNSEAKLVKEPSITELVKNNKDTDIIVVDKYLYDYLKTKQLDKMVIRYTFNLNNDSGFVINDIENNQLLYRLLNYYLLGMDNLKINNDNLYYLLSNPMKQSIYDVLAKYIMILVLIIFVGIIILYNFLQKKKVVNKVQKEEKLKYIDQMTSLKNRNYLNDNIIAWDDNHIYPQAIMIVDLNNLKYINDNHGHEAGDEVIKKAASILINTQKENTDIVRIDGNEFLIYMIGYPENEVVSYMRKLYKELKALPYDLGGAVGYSMIVDEIKTIDDAINEATLDMRVNKETSQKN